MRAKTINEEMKVAAAHAIANLARDRVPDEVASAMGGIDLHMEENTLYHLHLIQD